MIPHLPHQHSLTCLLPKNINLFVESQRYQFLDLLFRLHHFFFLVPNLLLFYYFFDFYFFLLFLVLLIFFLYFSPFLVASFSLASSFLLLFVFTTLVFSALVSITLHIPPNTLLSLSLLFFSQFQSCSKQAMISPKLIYTSQTLLMQIIFLYSFLDILTGSLPNSMDFHL